MDNAVLIQNATLSDIERMINLAVEKRMKEFYEQIQPKTQILLKRKEAAEFLKVSLPTIDSYSRNGLLHAKHIGGRVFFLKEEVLSINGGRATDKHFSVTQ